MKDYRNKVNNSYESSSSGSASNSVGENNTMYNSLNFDPNEGFAGFFLPASSEGTGYNTSVEEGIFPNILPNCPVAAPSYQPDYDYYNEYSTTPLVYSWMPIVPGFSQDGSDNLHNFEHIVKCTPKPLDISGNEGKNVSFASEQGKRFEKCSILNQSREVIKCDVREEEEDATQQIEANSKDLHSDLRAEERKSKISSSVELGKGGEETFRVNFSPEAVLGEVQLEKVKLADAPRPIAHKSPIKLDIFLLKRFKDSLADKPAVAAPPSISELPLSLSEMLIIYKANLELPDGSFKEVQSENELRPSCPVDELMKADWPAAMKINGHGLMYNRNSNCEEIELLTLKYCERFMKAETASSFNHKISPASAKKRAEKIKLTAQSPGSRLSHLANRRKVFSSANLKSSSTSQSLNKTFSGSGQFLIDKTKLYKKKKRTSAKKSTSSSKKQTPNKRVTPGKRRTPSSAKRQAKASLSIFKPESSAAATSKRALFTSPVTHKSSALPSTSRDLPKRMTMIPKRHLFSPAEKRKRSPSPDVENRFGKSRRLESPKRLTTAKNFLMASASTTAIAATTSSSSSLDEHKKIYRSHPHLNQLMDKDKNSQQPQLGFRKPLSETEKKKLLWAASSALQAKKINREHEKFKDYMASLCRLIRKIFSEFYNPHKSMSSQMTKFANLMVFYVIQGRSFDDIYAMTKCRLESQNSTKPTGYIAREDFDKSLFVRQKSSLVLLSDSLLSLAGSSETLASDISGSDTSLSRSSSKSNMSAALRENKLGTRENSMRKTFASESNLSLPKTSTPSSSNILKVKRQISF